MPAPSKSFTVIPDSDIDPDSPLTTGLVTALRDNDIHLEEWLGLSFTAAQDHDHDGVNSALVSITGQNIQPQHNREIFDHFMFNAADPNIWTVTGSPTFQQNEHYLEVSGSNFVTALHLFQIEQVHSQLEVRAKTPGTTTDFDNEFGMVGASRRAVWTDPSLADTIRAQTVGSGGTQNTDIAVDVDQWHLYRINQTSATQTVFLIDDVVKATHSTAVPDAQDLSVKLGKTAGGTNAIRFDYAHWWASSLEPSA